MVGKELKKIRHALGLTQVALAQRLGVTRNTVVRMEFGGQAITPSMELLIGYVAREAGVDVADSQRGGRDAEGKRAHAKAAKKTATRKVRKAV
jgi:transcriptional regulator with XRE-family HTH domain